jgi:hypothetical protein
MPPKPVSAPDDGDAAYPQSERYFFELKKADPEQEQGLTWLMDL